MKHSRIAMIIIVGFVALLGNGLSGVEASPFTLSNVPAYYWYNGCGPTAAGSVIGYWDLHGYPNLFTASGSAINLPPCAGSCRYCLDEET